MTAPTTPPHYFILAAFHSERDVTLRSGNETKISAKLTLINAHP